MNESVNKILKGVMKPLKELIIPTDKFSDWIFEQTKIRNVSKMHEGNFKGKDVYSTITFKFGEGLLSPFDKAVLLALINEREAGNEFVSVRRLFETLGGGNHLTAKMKEKLLDSVRRLMATIVKIECAEIVNLCYKGREVCIEGNLLHCNIITAKINSQVTKDAIQLVGDSPLLAVADIKNQIMRLPVELVYDLSFRGTENTISLLWYLLERVGEIAGSNSEERKKRVHKLSTSILFDTLCAKCGFTELNKRQKSRLRDIIRIILEHFKNCGLIDSFEFVKKYGIFYSVEISLKEKKDINFITEKS